MLGKELSEVQLSEEDTLPNQESFVFHASKQWEIWGILLMEIEKYYSEFSQNDSGIFFFLDWSQTT